MKLTNESRPPSPPNYAVNHLVAEISLTTSH